MNATTATQREALYVPDYLGPDNADYSRALAYVDGEYVPFLDAKISVRDLGLQRADLTYDVLHTWKRAFFRLDDHLDRFENSMRGMRLDAGLTRAQIKGILAELVRRSGLDYTLLYWACTRGSPPIGSREHWNATNTFFATLQPLILRGSPEQMRRGLSVTVSRSVRRIPADSVDPTLKNSHWGDFTRAQFLARDEGYDSVFLMDHAGNIAEGPGYNVVAVIDGGLLAPDANVLEGVSCRTMFEIAHMLGIPARYGTLSPAALSGADEVFITSTSCGLFPVTRIDGRSVGDGTPGPIATKLLNTYYRKKDEGWMLTPIDPA